MPAAALALLATLALAGAAPGAAGTGPGSGTPMLAGLLPCTPKVEACWPWSGVWVFPVGDSLEFGRGVLDEPGYRVNRGVLTRSADGTEHDGADLANGRPGGRVRAAASGLVVSVEPSSRSGYGSNIVIAHRLDDGTLVYSVYAHLVRGSTCVREGTPVSAGEMIARVGQTGRASTPHLHFEVRGAKDSTLRWENCPVEDPIAFVRERLLAARPDSDWAAPYLAWAEFAALVPCGLSTTTPLDAGLLSRVLERAGLRDRDAVSAAEVNATAGDGGADALGWNTIARALSALGARPKRLPPCGVEPNHYSQTCLDHLGVRRPARELHRLAGRDAAPTLGELCLALADFATKAPKPHSGRSVKRHRR